MSRRIGALILALSLATSIIGQSPIWADYSTAKEARDAAFKAMKDYQAARDNCMDITAPKYKLSPTEIIGIKIILEHAKTLLEDCLAQNSLAELPTDALNSDTGPTPLKSIDVYSDYISDFEAFIDTLQSTTEDIQDAVPAFASLGGVIGSHFEDLSKFEDRVKKFEANYSTEIKNEMSALPAWKQYQDLLKQYSVEKEKYSSGLLIVDEFEWVKDLTAASEDVVAAIGNNLLYSNLDNVLNTLADSIKPKASTVKSDTTSTQQKKIVITCVKGKTIKKIAAVNPKCPSGFKKK